MEGNRNIGYIVKDGNVHRVQLKFRKASVRKPEKKKKIILKRLNENLVLLPMIKCSEASPPMSPQEQRKKNKSLLKESASIPHLTSLASNCSTQRSDLSSREKAEILWRRTAKRIPKSKVLESRSAWALKEVSRINHKCMRMADIATPSNFNLALIRAPVPWKQQYLISREFLNHNHFATHQVSMEIRRLWTSKYENLSMFGSYSWNFTVPPESDELLNYVQMQCSNLRNALIQKWIPECHFLLMKMKPSWAKMVPLKNGESLQQIKRFFNSLARLMSILIRQLVYRWMNEWLIAMNLYKGSNEVAKYYSDSLFPLQPLIKVELKVYHEKIYIDPDLEKIHKIVKKMMVNIVDMSFQIPRVEMLFTDYPNGDSWLTPVSWYENRIQDIFQRSIKIVDTNRRGPEQYIQLVYGSFKPVLRKTFRDSYEEMNHENWSDIERIFKERVESLKNIKKNLLELKSHAYLNFFYLDCRKLNASFIEIVESIQANLTIVLLNENRKIVRSICNQFENVTEKVSHVPATTSDLVGSIEFVNMSQMNLSKMMDEVYLAGRRLLMLLNYTILQKEDVALSCRLFHWPKDLDSVLQVSAARLQRIRIETERLLKERTEFFLKRLVEYKCIFDNFKNREISTLTSEEMKNSTQLLQDLHRNLHIAKTELEEINLDEELLEWEITKAPTLPALIEHMEPYHQLWHIAFTFHQRHDFWFHGPFRNLDSQIVAAEIITLHKQIVQLGSVFSDVFGAKRVVETIRKRMEKFISYLPLLHAICNPGFTVRHWTLISANFDSQMCPEPETSLSELVSAGLMQFIAHIEEVSATATKEFALEETLKRMQAEWNDIRFEFLPYRDSDVCVLTGIEEIQALVDDHILRAQTMHASPFILPLEPLLQSWEEQLVDVQDTMDVWLKVQSTWLYLEPIFSSEDIQRQMASDAEKFAQVDNMWRSLMSGVTVEPRVLVTASRQGLLDELRSAFDILEDIQKGLHDYLEKKRLFFSRFYFLSNDELLEILSKTKEPERIQPHLRKCFDGISRLLFNSDHEIEAMISNENEIVKFRERIVPAKSKGMVELWMSEVDDAMKDALIHLTFMAMQEWKDYPNLQYFESFPGQCILCAGFINFTKAGTSTIESGSKWNELESTISSTLTHLTTLINTCKSPVTRTTISNLIILQLQARDIIQRLKAKTVCSIDNFQWQRNIRFYWNADPLEGLGHLTVSMVETMLPYGFEYMGNMPRIVVTPITEKGFHTIMLALKQYQGGWLYGLEGVGKTEIIKELALTIAKQCIVFNCFNGLDSKSIGRILKGIAQCGSWSCFDNIDVVAPDVVSIMALQIQTLQRALSRRLRRVGFEGGDIQLTSGSAFFITTKTKEILPDTFRSLFRAAAIQLPDLQFVIKISLLASGFQNNQSISVDLYHLLNCIKEKIPDYTTFVNFRSIKEILKLASRIKGDHADWDETTIINQAVTSFFKAQLTPEQGIIFFDLVNQKFPINQRQNLEFKGFFKIASDVCRELQLEPSVLFLEKVYEVWEILSNRNGVILLGSALAGKSTIFKVLAKVFPKISETSQNEDTRVVYQVISPWSLPSKYLYEWRDPEKNKWNDGIITKALRELSINSPTSPRWLILDGILHSELIGHLHTILDSSRKLALPSGEILQIPQTLRIIFETSDLSYASPSTISRCGVVRVDNIVNVDLLYLRWVKRSKITSFVQSTLENFMPLVVKPALEFVKERREDCIFPCSSSYLFMSFSRLFNSLLSGISNNEPIKLLYILRILTFSTVWTIGIVFKNETRNNFDEFIKGVFTQPKLQEAFGSDEVNQVLPTKSLGIFSYKLDVLNGSWILWKDVSLPKRSANDEIYNIVCNASVAIQYFFIKVYANGGVPTMILGNFPGVGKSLVTKFTIEELPKDRFVHNFVHITSATTSSSLQSSIMTGLDRRRKGVYGPALGRCCVLFVDNLIDCDPTEGYIRTPLELFRHWLNFECIFDGKTASKMELVDMQLVTAMRLTENFNDQVDWRLLRHMNIVFVDNFSSDDLLEMTTTMIERHFTSQGFVNAVTRLGTVVALATIDLYEKWVEKTVDGIVHYTVNISCVSRIIQGIKRVPSTCLTNANKLHRLWVHECCREWGDRLVSSDDRIWFLKNLDQISMTRFKLNLDQYLFASSLGSADYSNLPNIHFSTLQSIKSSEIFCDEVSDLDSIVSLIEDRLDQHNKKMKGTPVKLTVSLSVAKNIMHITQALDRQCGHVIIIGDVGSGRRSCSLVSALLLNYGVYQISVGGNYSILEWKEDIKQLIRRSGVQMEKLVFLCNSADFRNRSFFDFIGRLISGYEIPQLFTHEERMEMLETYQKQTKENATFSQIFSNVRENLRIILCVSKDDAIYNQFSLYPTIFKYASILWFEPWSEETLEVIAKKCLDDIQGLSDKLQSNYLNYFKEVHNNIQIYCKNKNMIQHSCSSYLELLATFRALWGKKEKELLQQKERYNVGLKKLEFAASQVVIMQEELRCLQPQLVETSAETESLMVKIEQDTVEVEAQKEIIAADEALANEAAAASQAIKDECESDLSEATPALEAAINALDTLKPADITLVKSMRHPPPIVKLVMEAVCVMKQIPPVKKLEMSTGKISDDYWLASQKLLGDLRFLDLLKLYDKDNIPTYVMKRIREKYIPNPEFNPNIVRHVSAACEGLCRWVRAMEVYDRVIKIVAPKRAKLQEAEVELSRQMKRLSEKHTQLQQITDKLQGLNDDFAAMSKKKKDLEDNIEKCRQKMLRAEKLIGGLGGEQENWKVSSCKLDFRLQQLPGDVMLSASIITYLGVFTHEQRIECIQSWLNLIMKCQIPCTSNFSLVDCLIDHVKMRAWNLAGLPNDKYSLDNGIITTHTTRWPLLIDPQEQGLKWILEIESKNQVQLIRYDESDYLTALAHSITCGRTVVMVNIKDKLSPELDNLLEKRTYVANEKTWIQIGSKAIEWTSSFRFYLVTKEEKSTLNVELSSKLTIVNFKLSQAGLEDKFLSLFLSEERPELEEQKQILMVQSASNQRQIRDLEDRILHVLSSSRGNILEDETATRTLYSSKITSEGISSKQKEIQTNEADIDKIRESYRPISSHAAALYSCIGQLKYLNSIYQFALPWFTNLFLISIKNSQNSMLIGERNLYVNEHFTRTLHQSICRALFVKDRLLFSVLLAFSALRSKSAIQQETIDRLYAETQLPVTNWVGPSWIDPTKWQHIMDLSKTIEKLKDLPIHIEANCEVWKLYCQKPECNTLPSPWNQLESLEQLLIVKHLKPTSFLSSVTGLIIAILGPNYEDNIKNDLLGAYEESTASIPILCFVSANSDPIQGINILCDTILENRNKIKFLSLGRGLERHVSMFIRGCMDESNWAVIQNLHLFPNILDEVVDDLKRFGNAINSEFRLWMIGYSTPKYSASALQYCVKTVSEPPNGFRDSMLEIMNLDFVQSHSASRITSAETSFQSVNPSTVEKENILYKSDSWRRISLALYCFHSLILERTRYGSLAFAGRVEFTYNDLKSALTLIKDAMLSAKDISLASLKALVVDCVYRASLTAECDAIVLRRLIDCVLNLDIFHAEKLTVSFCGLYNLPFNANRRALIEYVQTLPKDLGPKAIGLSNEAVKERQMQQSVELLRKLNCCSLQDI